MVWIIISVHIRVQICLEGLINIRLYPRPVIQYPTPFPNQIFKISICIYILSYKFDTIYVPDLNPRRK